jgi:F0F1-type ATP synthase epsilon subunit
MEKVNFHLKVQSRDALLFEGDVNSVTSFNEEGKFDILAQHARFISLINKGLSIVDANGQKKDINFDNALLRVKDDLVEVYVGVEGMSPSQLHPSTLNQIT